MKTITKDQSRAIIKNRTGLVKDLRLLTGLLEEGNSASAIALINSASVKEDVESLLGRELTPEEGRALLLSPEHIEDELLRKALAIAKELQTVRTAARRICRFAGIHGLLTGRNTGDEPISEEELEHS